MSAQSANFDRLGTGGEGGKKRLVWTLFESRPDGRHTDPELLAEYNPMIYGQRKEKRKGRIHRNPFV